MSSFHSPQYLKVQPAQTFQLFSLAVQMQSTTVDCGVSPSVRLSVILPLPIRGTHRSQMITYESESKPVGPEKERMRRTSLSSLRLIFLPFSLISFPPFFLSLLLILLSLHHPIPHYQSWPNADLYPLTSQLHYPLQPFLHIHPRRGASFPLFATPTKLSPPIPPKYRSPKPLPHIPSLIVYDFIFNQMWRFLNLRGESYGGQWSFGRRG